MYAGLSIYLLYFCTHRKTNSIPLWKFFLCALVDSHATILSKIEIILNFFPCIVVKSYLFTSITSVMLLQVSSIPWALLLSLLFLRVRYSWPHYLALCLCGLGVACSVVNDVVLNPKTSGDSDFTLNALYGDLMVLGGAFLYAL